MLNRKNKLLRDILQFEIEIEQLRYIDFSFQIEQFDICHTSYSGRSSSDFDKDCLNDLIHNDLSSELTSIKM